MHICSKPPICHTSHSMQANTKRPCSRVVTRPSVSFFIDILVLATGEWSRILHPTPVDLNIKIPHQNARLTRQSETAHAFRRGTCNRQQYCAVGYKMQRRYFHPAVPKNQHGLFDCRKLSLQPRILSHAK